MCHLGCLVGSTLVSHSIKAPTGRLGLQGGPGVPTRGQTSVERGGPVLLSLWAVSPGSGHSHLVWLALLSSGANRGFSDPPCVLVCRNAWSSLSPHRA